MAVIFGDEFRPFVFCRPDFFAVTKPCYLWQFERNKGNFCEAFLMDP